MPVFQSTPHFALVKLFISFIYRGFHGSPGKSAVVTMSEVEKFFNNVELKKIISYFGSGLIKNFI